MIKNERQAMKTKIAAIGLMGLMWCGCGESARERAMDRKLAVLQDQVNVLQSEIATNQTATASGVELGEADKNYCDAISALQTMDEQTASNLDFRVTGLESWQAECQALAAGARSRSSTLNAPLQDGIPDEVYKQIWAGAVEKWPNDYEMESYEVKQQVAAWKELHGQ
jgi:hypothetical protein